MSSSTTTNNKNLLRLTVPVSNNDNVGLVAVGDLGDAHEAALYWRSKEQEQQQDGSSSSILADTTLLFETCCNNLPSNKRFYENLKTKRFPRRGSGTHPRDLPTFNLYPVLGGEWLAGRLLFNTATSDDDSTSKIATTMMCGALFWHVDTVGSTLEEAAKVVRRDICIEGQAGQYNAREETNEFFARGGRIMGRCTWDAGGASSHAHNQALPKTHNDKFNEDHFEQSRMDGGVYGPDFVFYPVSTYFESTWPVLQKKGYGVNNNNTTTDMDDDYDDDDDEPRLQSFGPSSFYAFFAKQEYLAGRILTSRVLDKNSSTTTTSNNATTMNEEQQDEYRAIHAILLFTYSCPEQIGDATLEGVPLSSNLAASALRTPSGFVSFAGNKQTTIQQLRNVLSVVSADKIMELLECSIVRRDQYSSTTHLDVLIQVVQKVIPALYDNNNISSAPDMARLHNHILIYAFDFELLGVFLRCFHNIQKLETLITCEQERYNQNTTTTTTTPEEQSSQYPSSETTLALCPNIQCAQLLLDAGATLSIRAITATMDRPNVFLFLWQKYEEQQQQQNNNKNDSSSSTKSITATTREICLQASRNMHASVLNLVLDSMTKEQRQELLSDMTFAILEPSPFPHDDDDTPPPSRGTLIQVAMGNYAMSLRYDVGLRKEFNLMALHSTLSVLYNMLWKDTMDESTNKQQQQQLPNDFWVEACSKCRRSSIEDPTMKEIQQNVDEAVKSVPKKQTTTTEGGGNLCGRLQEEEQKQSEMYPDPSQMPPGFLKASRFWFQEAARATTTYY